MEARHKKAEIDYNNGMKYKDIAKKYGVSINTVKSWKRRHGWERNKVANKKRWQLGNKNTSLRE
ncbi:MULTISPECIES: phage terminase small subunit-related protein [Clostridia]|uniref:phage terminase small subunit-related protein n=1 Tax=Clostridia TaxID=186801 RepID=UPI000EA31360|nr:hypothetical protein [Roseburia sp. 1XD42-34]RKI79928.1 hypothetical protein D7V87_05990 [Clostridium sp. 1xD42-85]